MSFYDSKEYIFNFFGEILSLPFTLLVISLFWSSILKTSPQILIQLNTTSSSIIFYYIVVSCVQYALSPFWYLNYPIYKDIINGSMSIYRSRPIDYVNFISLRYIGEAFTRLFITGVCLIVIGIIFPSIKLSVPSIIFFIFVLIEIIIIVFSLQFLIASVGFSTEAIFGLRDLLYEIMYFFGGLIIPLSFMPEWLFKITNLLPFKFIYDYPANILIEGISDKIIQEQFILLVWMIVLVISSRLIFNTAQKRFTANGG